MQPSRLVTVLAIVGAAVLAAGRVAAACPDLRYIGRAGDEFLFAPILTGYAVEGGVPSAGGAAVVVVLSRTADRAASYTLPPDVLPAVAGHGRRGWVAARVARRPFAVAIRPFGSPEREAVVKETVLEVPFTPATYSWSEDARGPWVFVGGRRGRIDVVAAFALEAGRWRPNGIAEALLLPPEYDATNDTILMAGWRFARDRRASPIPLPKDALHRGALLNVDVVPLSSRLMLATAGKRVWTSIDGGETWKRIAVPWSDAEAPTAERVRGEPGRAVFSWRSASGDVVIAEWAGSWREVTPFSSRGRAPKLSVHDGASLIALTACQGSGTVDVLEVTVVPQEAGKSSRDIVIPVRRGGLWPGPV